MEKSDSWFLPAVLLRIAKNHWLLRSIVIESFSGLIKEQVANLANQMPNQSKPVVTFFPRPPSYIPEAVIYQRF
jgi:hypothetical protein